MAVINISSGFAGGKGGPTNHPPLFREESTETITSAVASTATTITAPAVGFGASCAAFRLYTDTAIWIEIGKAPVAAANSSMYVPAGSVEFFYADLGDKMAVLEA